jgi:hypothetical protein
VEDSGRASASGNHHKRAPHCPAELAEVKTGRNNMRKLTNEVRELSSEELDHVAGGWGVSSSAGNPGNLKPVGNAGEAPNGNTLFYTVGTAVGTNGAYGFSAN